MNLASKLSKVADSVGRIISDLEVDDVIYHVNNDKVEKITIFSLSRAAEGRNVVINGRKDLTFNAYSTLRSEHIYASQEEADADVAGVIENYKKIDLSFIRRSVNQLVKAINVTKERCEKYGYPFPEEEVNQLKQQLNGIW